MTLSQSKDNKLCARPDTIPGKIDATPGFEFGGRIEKGRYRYQYRYSLTQRTEQALSR